MIATQRSSGGTAAGCCWCSANPCAAVSPDPPALLPAVPTANAAPRGSVAIAERDTNSEAAAPTSSHGTGSCKADPPAQHSPAVLWRCRGPCCRPGTAGRGLSKFAGTSGCILEPDEQNAQVWHLMSSVAGGVARTLQLCQFLHYVLCTTIVLVSGIRLTLQRYSDLCRWWANGYV